MQSALPFPSPRGPAPVRPVTQSLKPPILSPQAPADTSSPDAAAIAAAAGTRSLQSAAAAQQPLRPVRPSWTGAATWSPTRQLLSEPQLQIYEVLRASSGLAGSQQLSSQVCMGWCCVCVACNICLLLQHAWRCHLSSATLNIINVWFWYHCSCTSHCCSCLCEVHCGQRVSSVRQRVPLSHQLMPLHTAAAACPTCMDLHQNIV